MVKLALLWHMHQPYYEDLATGEHILPWVRLHAIKDYWGMAALLEEFPRVRVTFNLVPSLLVQIEAFAADRAHDRHLFIGLAPAESLAPADRAFLVANGFHAPFERMIAPLPRYAELYARRQDPETFTTADVRDLQVLHKLVWMDPDWRARDPRLRALEAKQRNYDEADKAALREVELELLAAVIPAYRDAEARGSELSTSPFYHPILPLLCDSDVHFRAHPHSALPKHLFAWPSDAELQVSRAIRLHHTVFGHTPRGVWPSEGSVSDIVLAQLAEHGIQWTASDEEILARSLRRPLSADDLYRPYTAGTAPRTIRMLFRDHRLSDLIGFAYQSWDAETAAQDFLARVRDAGRRFAQQGSGDDAVVTVILDGENAWEHYEGGGRPFLRALYRGLQNASDVQTVTMSEAASGWARTLPSVFPGSWINGDFYIWAGHRDDHRAWTQLAAARRAFADRQDVISPEARAQALEELLIAEGSDWFWWYGDDHSSAHDREFDELFRRHLRNVYRAIGQPAPDELYVSNISTVERAGPIWFQQLGTPPINGAAADFLGWRTATEIPLGEGGGTMHRVSGHLVRRLRVAADREALYLRLDGPELADALGNEELGLAVLAERPRQMRLELTAGSAGPRYVARTVTTAVVPFATLGAQAGERVSLTVLITDRAGHVVEHHPVEPFEFDVPSRRDAAMRWVV